jgi:outer membrane protein TolC
MWHFRSFPRGLTAILTVLLFISPAFSQDNHRNQKKEIKKITLADSVVLALKNNLDVRSAFLDRIVQRVSLKVAEYGFQPQSSLFLSGQINSLYSDPGRSTGGNQGATYAASLLIPTGGRFGFTWDNRANKTEFSQDAVYSSSWNLSFTQPLLKGGGIDAEGVEVATASLKIARINEEQNVLFLKSTLISIINSTIQTYRSYVQAQRQLEISKRSLVTTKQLFEVNKALIEAGRMAEVEIVQTEADIANRELGILQAENSVESTRLALIQILNIDKDTLFEPVEETEVQVKPPPFDKAMAIALNNRPDYIQALRNVETVKLNFIAAKRNRLWDWSLQAGIERGVSNSGVGSTLGSVGNLGKTNWNIGTMLTIPIRDLTIEQSYISAKIGLEKANLSLKKMEINLGIEVQNGIRDVGIKFRQVEMAKQATILIKKKLEIEQEKLKVGRTTNFQLLSFQNDLVNAQVSELGAVIDYLNGLTSLDQTLGTTLGTWGVEVKKEDDEIKLLGPDKKVSR